MLGRSDYTVRIMGVVEGWVVYRRTGTMPALCYVNEFRKLFVRAPLPPKPKRTADQK